LAYPVKTLKGSFLARGQECPKIPTQAIKRVQQLGWCQDNGNRSNQESKFDFLATHQRQLKIEEGQQKIKIVRTNLQSNLGASCQSIFSLCRHHPIQQHILIIHFFLPTSKPTSTHSYSRASCQIPNFPLFFPNRYWRGGMKSIITSKNWGYS